MNAKHIRYSERKNAFAPLRMREKIFSISNSTSFVCLVDLETDRRPTLIGAVYLREKKIDQNEMRLFV